MKRISLILTIFCSVVLAGCQQENSKVDSQNKSEKSAEEEPILQQKNVLDSPPMNEHGEVQALIEIPLGTREKWEMNKELRELYLEEIDGKPRIVNYLPYPANYGMIPQTLLSKELGGDGDPIDVIVLGDYIERGTIVSCNVIGVLKLLDRGEQDDKLIAVANEGQFKNITSLKDLELEFKGVKEIIETWFANYKGSGKMESQGFGEAEEARNILQQAIEQYK